MKNYILFLILSIIAFCAKAEPGPQLVGATFLGGLNHTGTIIFYTGGDTSLRGEFNFPGTANIIDTVGPINMTLTEAPNGMLYGLNLDDSTHGFIYQFDYSSHSYAIKATFDNVNGANPYGALILANNGMLCGLASAGGQNNSGTLFSYIPGSDSIVKLVDLPLYAEPQGNLLQASDGNLYGMTSRDGANFGGTIFQYDMSSGQYLSLYNLAYRAWPYGSLIEVGKDTLYGLTYGDGTYYGGTLFQYAIDSGTYTVLYNFDVYDYPYPEVVHATNGKLYGFTGMGTRYDDMFSYDIDSAIYEDIYEFYPPEDSQYSVPSGIFQASNGMLYGTTTFGGLNSLNEGDGLGTIFQYNIFTATYAKNVNLDFATGCEPQLGHLIEIAPPIILTQPLSQTVCIGDSAIFAAHVNGIFTAAQWQVSTDGGATFTNIPGANDTGYSLEANRGLSGYQYRAVFTNINISDTTTPAVLTVPPPADTVISTAVCQGSSYSVGLNTYTSPGTFTDTLFAASVNGCDSIVKLNLTVNPVYTDTINATICGGDFYTFNNNTYLTTGSYNNTLQTVNGCDSLVTLNLLVKAAQFDFISQTICEGDTFMFNGSGYTSAGSYNDTLQAINTCDSIVTLMLSVDSISVSIIADTTTICSYDSVRICAPDTFASYIWNTGQTTNCIETQLALNYEVTVTDNRGCDAFSNQLAISVYPSPAASLSVSGDTIQAYGASNYQWYLNDTLLPGETDSILIATQSGTYFVQVTDTEGCTASSNGQTVKVNGIFDLQNLLALKLYPDPAFDELNISYTLNKPTALQITITDITGRLITNILNDKQSGVCIQHVNIHQLASGVYILHFTDENGSVNLRFVKD